MRPFLQACIHLIISIHTPYAGSDQDFAFDPEGMHEAQKLLTDVHFCDGPYGCAEDADVLVILTEWDSFRALDLDRLKLIMRRPVMVDLRNVYRPDDMRRRGFTYASIGRGTPDTPLPAH